MRTAYHLIAFVLWIEKTQKLVNHENQVVSLISLFLVAIRKQIRHA